MLCTQKSSNTKWLVNLPFNLWIESYRNHQQYYPLIKPLVYVIRNSFLTSKKDVVKHPRRFQIFHDTCHFIKLCTQVELNFLFTELKSRENVLLRYKLDFYE